MAKGGGVSAPGEVNFGIQGRPGWHCQRPAIGPPDDGVDLVARVVQPGDREALCAQRTVAVVDRDFRSMSLMGGMSIDAEDSNRPKIRQGGPDARDSDLTGRWARPVGFVSLDAV